MTKDLFSSPESSHAHSLLTLNALYEYDDFMMSVKKIADLGCGAGLDLEWWATRTTRDDVPKPLNITCYGIDLVESLPIAHKYRNIQFQRQDFEQPIVTDKKKFDVLWCHDAFQYVINPFDTLSNWWNVLDENGMLALILPQSVNMEFNTQAFDQRDGCYYNWTTVSLIHALAVSGFDCRDGFFRKEPDDPWLHAVVYKSNHAPMDPRKTSWYQLADLNLIPESATASVTKYGLVRQRDLTLPWVDGSLHWYGRH